MLYEPYLIIKRYQVRFFFTRLGFLLPPDLCFCPIFGAHLNSSPEKRINQLINQSFLQDKCAFYLSLF